MQLRVSDLGVDFVSREKRSAGVALRGFSMQIAANQFVAIVGPSGCGKTTLLRTLMGLQPTTSGTIEWDGQTVSDIGVQSAMVFQAPNLFPWRSVSKNISYGLDLQGIAQPLIDQRVNELIGLTGLDAHVNKRTFELSGGMQQRVNLARALALKPAVLLMDEPFSALDSILREQLQRELEHIWLNASSMVLFVTHQLDEALWLADEVLVIGASPGRVTLRVVVDLPRPRARDAASIAHLAELQTQIRDHLLASGCYAGR